MRLPLLAGHYGYFSIVAKAGTFRTNSWIIRQRNVDDAAVGGGHGFEGNAAPSLDDAAGHFGGHVTQGGFPPLPVPFHIQRHPYVFPKLFTDNQIDQILEKM